MKLTLILLTVGFLNVNAKGLSQNINFAGKNVPLKKIFTEIEKQTGYATTYTADILADTRPVSVIAENLSLKDFLILILKDQPIDFSIEDKTILLSRKPAVGEFSDGQSLGLNRTFNLLDTTKNPIDIKGRIVNENGEPIIATVQVKGTNKGVATNGKGEFELKAVDKNATLVISGVSIKSFEVKVNGRSELATIKSETKLIEGENVIITAYGQEKRIKETGYAIQKIDGREITQAHPINLLNGLTGKIAGLNVTTTVGMSVTPTNKILLRGIRSLNGDNTPLFVIDGTILTIGGSSLFNATPAILNLFNSINPDDVENITILKGANASTLYGPEGVNGVIVINTKKGNAGKTQVNFSQTTSFQSVDENASLKLQKEYGSGFIKNQYGDGTTFDRYGGFGYNWGPKFDGSLVTIGRPDENGDTQQVRYQYTNERFKAFNNAVTLQNDLSLSGGDSRSHYFLSVQYADIKGMIPGDRVKRTTVRLNADKVYGRLKAMTSIGIIRSDNDISTGNFVPLVFTTSSFIPLTKFKDFKNDKWSDHNHYYDDNNANPYEDAAIKRNRFTSYTVLGNIALDYKIFDWLSITNRVGLNYYTTYGKSTVEAIFYSDFVRTNGRTISAVGSRPASLIDNFGITSGLNNDLLLTMYKKGSVFSFRGLLGNSLKETYSKNIEARASSLTDPNVFNLSFSNGAPAITEQSYKSRSVSVFGNVTTGYKEFVFLELTARNDLVSSLNGGTNPQLYYGANTSIILTDIFPGVTKNNILSFLRIRSAWNKTANFNYTTYVGARAFNQAPGFPFGTNYNFTLATSFTSKDIKPEKITSQEYGAEINFFKDRIKLDVSHYYQVNDGLINSANLSYFSGFTSTSLNVGKFKNKGWEFALQFNPDLKIIKDFKFSIDGNFSINDNRVLSLYGSQTQISTQNGLAIVGYPAYSHYLYDWRRDSLGRVIVDRITGLPSQDPVQKVKGRTLPKYMVELQ